MKKNGVHIQESQQEGRQEGEALLGPRPIMPHELQNLHRLLRGALLQLETTMRRLDVSFKITVR